MGHVFEQFRAVHRFPHVDTSDECSPLFFLGYYIFAAIFLNGNGNIQCLGFCRYYTLINAQDVIYAQGGKDEHDPERENTRDVGERKKE